VITFVQVSEAVFCEAMYIAYRNNETMHHRRPLPRGSKILKELKNYIDWLEENSKIQIVSDYTVRNGTS
jgi:hypothetical protein